MKPKFGNLIICLDEPATKASSELVAETCGNLCKAGHPILLRHVLASSFSAPHGQSDRT